MRTKGKNLARVEQDRLPDEVLEQTFPASDPIALQTAERASTMCFRTCFLQEKGSGITVVSR